MRKRVVIDQQQVPWIAKLFDVSRVTVWRALTYNSNTELARKIRSVAVHRGGVKLSGDHLDIFEDVVTTYEDGRMIKRFSPEVMAVLEMEEGCGGYIEVNGVKVREYEFVALMDVPAIHAEAWDYVKQLKMS